RWIAAGLLAGILCGLFFGEYCAVLEKAGQAYVGLLQMTVLPYLTISLIAKTGRLDMQQARELGAVALVVLLVLWLIGVALVVAISASLPPVEGASFFSPAMERGSAAPTDVLSRFIPSNVFRSLSDEVVPAVVVFCLFFGIALIPVPGKENFLDFLDLCTTGISRINLLLIRLAPIGLFALASAAAGTMRLEQLERLQAYIIMFATACVVAVLCIIPGLLSSVTRIGYRNLIAAAQEPVLTVIATGKLFVVLPQIVERSEYLLQKRGGSESADETAVSVVVPLAYPFPHLGKILAFLFVSFAAWYVGRELTIGQTTTMAATGAISSFSSPLVTIPYLLDQYQLPQDLMPLFILPGFVTTRLADVVGVLHLMVLSLIVNEALQGRLRIRWRRLAATVGAAFAVLALLVAANRSYLSNTALDYDLDDRLLSLEVSVPYQDVIVYTSTDEVPDRVPPQGSMIERIKKERVMRVGYHADHLPYSFFNRHGHLVGLDVELMHRLAARLQVRLEFVPYAYATVTEQLESGQIDLAVGGFIMTPERSLRMGFSQPYATATASIVVPDYRRGELETWNDLDMPSNRIFAVVHEDLARAARRQLPGAEIVVIDSYDSFFSQRNERFDGLII
ncbi:MAG: cation:dicarboxylase symporter family transporter, partial [Planctomycetes bacterium]|nr:cation:dicarboxylase symporter family transporter [Planctomycetota bacterium]